MIFPTPMNPKRYQEFPITWMLVFLNFLLFILVFTKESTTMTDSEFFQEGNIQRTGIIYHHLLSPDDSLSMHNENEIIIWARQAIKDRKFFMNIEKLEPWGDPIEFEAWKKLAINFRNEFVQQPSFKFGLSSQKSAFFNWITYQFAHASWSHLLSNLVFLIIIGAAVEALAGGLAVIGLYLCGGIAGGLTFLMADSHGIAPLVGASASISALMAFYAVFESRDRIRYFFILTPLEPIYLSPKLIIPIYLVADVTSWLSSPRELSGSIAYTAHLGGAAFGLLMYLSCKYVWKISPLKKTTEVLRADRF